MGSDDRHVVLVVPLPPDDRGNGLAMRAGLLLDAFAECSPVEVVVVPVSGLTDDLTWARRRAHSVTTVEPVDPGTARAHVVAQLGDPALRARLEATAPVPARAALAPPTLAADVEARLARRDPPRLVVVLRLYLAPLGIELARRLRADRVLVDVDDDDEALFGALGDEAEAAAYGRLARAWLPEADSVVAASDETASAVRERYGLARVAGIPNAVAPVTDTEPRTGSSQLLFVGNLTYRPNIDAARVLAGEILPRVRAQRPDASIDIVGQHDPGTLDDLAGLDGVHLAGRVASVAPWYAAADVVTIPLTHGSGSRIKVLEAFAHRRPVVASTAAVAGLDVQDGADLIVADGAAALADAAIRVLEDDALANALVDHAARTHADRYTPAAVAPRLRAA